MSDPKKVTEKTEVTTQTERDSDATGVAEYEEETTVKTERTVEVEEEREEKPVIVIEHD